MTAMTARDVIHEFGLEEEEYENTDALIERLDTAGFVIVHKSMRSRIRHLIENLRRGRRERSK